MYYNFAFEGKKRHHLKDEKYIQNEKVKVWGENEIPVTYKLKLGWEEPLKLSKWEIPEWVQLREIINVKIVFGEFALIQQDKRNVLKGKKIRVK